MDLPSTLDLVSSRKQVKQASIAANLSEIVPANRSSLTSDRLLGKKSLVTGLRNMDDFDEKASDQLIPCTSKKPKLLIAGPDQSKHCEKPHRFNNSVKRESLRFLENVCSQSSEETEVLASDEIIAGKTTVELNIGKHKDSTSQSVPHNNDETKGSAFLIQVKMFEFLQQLHVIYYLADIYLDFSSCLIM